eukprot:8722258-Pyramimonas_sp.AAC.1
MVLETSGTQQDRSSTPKMAPKRPKRPSRAIPRDPQEATSIDVPSVVDGSGRSRLFGFPTLQDSPRGLRDRPKTA